MNVLQELKRAWENARTYSAGKNADSADLQKLKEEINGSFEDAPVERPALPDPPKYEEMKGDSSTDEQLAGRAEQALKEYKNSSLAGIDNSIAAEKEKIGSDRADYEKQKEQSGESIDSAYDKARISAENDALKRGLARSSIAVNRVADLESQRAQAQTQAQKEYADAVSALDERLSSLEVKRQKAIDDFNVSLAVKLRGEIDKLTEQRDEVNREALKYNNALAEQRAKDMADKLKTESGLYLEALSQKQKEEQLKSSPEAKERQYRSNYEKMDELLSGMNRSAAARLLKEDMFFRNNLSDYLYYTLYEKYAR